MPATFTFDSTHRTLLGTAAGLNGSTIDGYLPGDDIQISDKSLNSTNINVSITGHTLTYNGGSLTINNLGPGRIVIRDIPGGGVDLRLQQDAHNDFNGDGRSDVLWQSDSGALSDWVGTSTGGFGNNDGNAASFAPAGWTLAGTGDFNGDGRVDLLWRSNTGALSDWLGTANGGFANNDAHAATWAPTDWKVVGAGDFNGDGITDILWRNTTSGAVSDWLGNSSGGFTGNDTNASSYAPTNWTVVATGDFNGDGHDDILWRSDTGALSDWLGTANGGFANNDAHAATWAPTDWKVVGAGDFNGDGITDILWRNTTSGALSDWLGNSSGGFTNNDAHAATWAPASWHVVGIGDFNGDGHSDILWRSDTGAISDWLGTANGGFVNNDANAAAWASTTWHVENGLLG